MVSPDDLEEVLADYAGRIKRLEIEVMNLERRLPSRPASLDGLPDEATSFSGLTGAKDHIQVNSDDAVFVRSMVRQTARPSRWSRFWCWLLRRPVPAARPLVSAGQAGVAYTQRWTEE